MAIVYVTTNLVNGKKYLGKHNGKNSTYLGSGNLVKYAIRKYGRENFVKTVVAECITEQEAYGIEEKFSREWNVVSDPNWYNMKVGGDGFRSGPDHPMFGVPKSEEHRLKLSISQIGKTHSTEQNKKHSIRMSGESNPMYGKRGNEHPGSFVRSEVTRKRMSKPKSKEHALHISKALRGMKRSPDQIERNRTAQLVRVVCPTCNKIGTIGVMRRYHFDNCKRNL